MAETKSMVDIAYDFMTTKKRPISFSKLWEVVSKATKSSNDKISQFYSDLTLDARFVSLNENKWDLKNRRKFAESQFDTSSIEIDDDNAEATYEDEKDPAKNSDNYN